ncbi:Formate dehydrogenase H [Pseudovibrio axinellae]|uniref:Formate dehydrogenase H n=1 Tax=Pseudovibrio axinellae TaxID=989403 RepID=A0A165YD26_9HYPH|nr:FdhF/YdeP family oxidoreductase [Pseudovibrio axinellae]KZL18731.1 Formate dehydrogenase H [Pseudovibrio axinellae]SEP94903.1 formate dehydrogenase F4A subunit [Pseudovibrio axinellae]
MSDKIIVKKPMASAGGWGAVWSCGQALLQSTSIPSSFKTVLKTNQPDGFVCPGCAWGVPEEPSSIEFCENGVKAVAREICENRVTEPFLQEFTVSELQTFSDFDLEDQGRLTTPLRYNRMTDRYSEITWAEAFKEIGAELRALKERKEAVFYASGRTSNEAAFLYQLFGRLYGTNNFPSSTDMCHEASHIALEEAIGSSFGTVRLEDFAKSDAIFIFGHNPGSNHPRMLNELRSANRRGAQVVSFNPLKECGLERFSDPKNQLEMMRFGSTPIASHFFTPKSGGDMAAVRGMAKAILTWEYERILTHSLIDRVFIEENCNGFESYEKAIELTPWKDIEDQSGLTRDEIEQAALIYVQADRPIITWGTGLSQHKHSVASLREIMNLLLLCGNIGKLGAGACPMLGHSNAQGMRRMGVSSSPQESFLESLEQVFNFEVLKDDGAGAAATVKLMNENKVRIFLGLGGNFTRAAPDTDLTEEAMRKCRLTVHIATKLNRSHLMPGSLSYILPCLGRTEVDEQRMGEQLVSVEDLFSKVRASYGFRPPASESLKSEVAIICGLARATLGNKDVNWSTMESDYDHIREKIEEVLSGFTGFNSQLRSPSGFDASPRHSGGTWATGSGRAMFSGYPLPLATTLQKTAKAKKLTFTLQSIRSIDQFNTSVHSQNDRYRGIFGGRKVVFINPTDMRRAGLAAGAKVDIATISEDGRNRRALDFQIVPYEIPEGSIASYFPEVNVLFPVYSTGDQSGTPTSKAIPVVLTKSRRRT